MKFAKELEQELVPEWRAAYFDYKAGKKKLNAVAKALREATSSPRTLMFTPSTYKNPAFNPSPAANEGTALTRTSYLGRSTSQWGQNGTASLGRSLNGATLVPEEHGDERAEPVQIPERQRLNPSPPEDLHGRTRYGSIIATPPDRVPLPSMLELPDPAIDPADESSVLGMPLSTTKARTPDPSDPPPKSSSSSQPSPSAGSAKDAPPPFSADPNGISKPQAAQRPGNNPPRRVVSTPASGTTSQALLARILHRTGSLRHKADRHPAHPEPRGNNYARPLERYREVDKRQAEFFKWMDGELKKIEEFYAAKEQENVERLRVLREQLHEMRDRRMAELVASQRAREGREGHEVEGLISEVVAGMEDEFGHPNKSSAANDRSSMWITFKDVEHLIEAALKGGEPGKGSRAMRDLASPPGPKPRNEPGNRGTVDDNRDFVRRKQTNGDVPYKQAKKKLKQALQEYYRGLELLKSYSLLNRTAFRKMNKKYDKVVNARPTGRYMAEKVNKAHFVQGETLDNLLLTVEDLYARYFERGSHKVAVGKLRHTTSKNAPIVSSVYRNGLLFGAGLVLGVQGIIKADIILNQAQSVGNITLLIDTQYLLQIYAGVFLSLTLFMLFVLSCKIWADAKINYVFIFEFETRHNLDWRQLAEIPSLFIFLLGLFIFINFGDMGAGRLYTYFPVVMIGLMVGILFLPVPLVYHRSRRWLLYSHWRLLLSGLYPVEFRDFFLGDQYCSQTYTMGNIFLFFCLYKTQWDNPANCNSSHSRAFGFFTCLPGIWRALQCARRYYDTRVIFPHMANCGKYLFTILYYMSLSIYRIEAANNGPHTQQWKAFFIFCAVINSIYTSIWDLVMDWSLGNPNARYPFLRKTLGFKQVWFYYAAMIIDPILRFNWIPYALIRTELQHSAILSFFVSFSEVIRRGMWGIFRMENEHCTNVGRFRASRDVPLPYHLPSSPTYTPEDPAKTGSPIGPAKGDQTEPFKAQPTPPTTPAVGRPESEPDLEAAATPRLPGSGLRQRRGRSFVGPASPLTRGLERVGTAMAAAHAQDFERRRPNAVAGAYNGEESSDDDDDDDEGEERIAELEEMGRGEQEDYGLGVTSLRHSRASAATDGGYVEGSGERRDFERRHQTRQSWGGNGMDGRPGIGSPTIGRHSYRSSWGHSPRGGMGGGPPSVREE